MGVDIAAYRARIGRFNVCKVNVYSSAKSDKQDFMSGVMVSAAIIAILLIIGNVELNPGPTTGTKNEGNGNNEMKDFMIALSNQLNEKIDAMNVKMDLTLSQNEELRVGHKEIVKENRELDKKIANVNSELNIVKYSYNEYEKEMRKNNLVIFGVEELGYERNIDTCYIVLDILAKYCGLNISEYAVNNAYRVGRGRRRTIILKLNNFFVKENILENAHKLKGSRIVIENDYTREVREVRKSLVNYMKKARQLGMRASISYDKLRINGRLYDLEYLKKNDVPVSNETNGKMFENSRLRNRNRSISPNRRRQFEERNFVRRALSEERTSGNAVDSSGKVRDKEPNWRLESNAGINDIRNYMNREFRSSGGREVRRCSSVERRVWSRDGEGTNFRGRQSPEISICEQRVAETNLEGAVGGIPVVAEGGKSRSNNDGKEKRMEDCGGYVENMGGAITMMNMVEHGVKTYDCVWLIRPPKNYLHLRTHLLLKVATFNDMAGSTELQVLQGQTSETPILEILRHPAAHAQSSNRREHVVPVNVGFYVSLRGTFGPLSRLAIVYTAFSYMDCFTGPDFLCQNHRCIPSQLSCDGFDHCGDNSDEPNTCYQDWEAEPQDRRWYSHTPNYFFPKMERYPDLKTATLIFIVCSLGLILLIVALMILLYRMGARARQQREIQNRLQTISELLDGARIDEASPPDDPPVYEAPPDYDEVIKVFLEPIDCQRQKKKKCHLPRRGRSTRRNRSTPRNTSRNGDIPVANEQCCTQPAALLEVALPNPVACSTPNLRVSSGPSQISCGITSRSCQTTPIPDSPPPPYADATHSVTPGPSSHQQLLSPHDTSRICKSERLSKRGRALRQSWLLFRQESAQDQLLSVVITGVGCPPVDQDTNDAFQPTIAIPSYKLLAPLTENGSFSNCSPTLFHTDKLNRMNCPEEVDPHSVTNLVSIEEASSSSQSLSPNLADDFNISQMISMENRKTSVRRGTMLEVKHLPRNFISFDDLITEGICHSVLPMRKENVTANFPTLINRRCSSHNSICLQSAPSREFSTGSDSELDSNRRRTSINVRSRTVHPQIGRDIGLFVENKEMAVKKLTKNRPPTGGNLTICSSSVSNCECEGACGCATIDNHTNLKSNVNQKGKHMRSLSAGFPSTSSSSPRSRHLRELDIYFSQHEVGLRQLATPVSPLQNCNTSGHQSNADIWQTDSRSVWETLDGNIITQT